MQMDWVLLHSNKHHLIPITLHPDPSSSLVSSSMSLGDIGHKLCHFDEIFDVRMGKKESSRGARIRCSQLVSTIGNKSSNQAARLVLIFCFFLGFNERQEVSNIINQPELFLMIQMGGLLFNDLKDCDECTVVVYTSNCNHLLGRGCGTLWPCHLH